ncbi:FAD-dependent oxidoreductase [Nitrospirillum sp. BR 11164]|uniref:oxidoreductase n=1 Tax=Nitrospirillum sp. BR 11164 TaxID=3104324 RepID=UPI002AFF5B4C|nr:FAD-dependent oxidoreductase [Nitrospirillum sp. BR 11164]
MMAPMESHLGNADGSVSPELIAYYRERALGGVGMVVVEFTCVDGHDGFSSLAPQLRLDTPFYRTGHGKLAAAIQSAGARACVQLSHAGRQSREAVIGRQPVAPSAVPLKSPYLNSVPRALDAHEMDRLIQRYAGAAAMAIQAGYDAVMLHGAHGYLLQQFLSPLVNQRDDEWGGDFERRLRFPLEVVRAVRAAIGDRPLLYRMSVSDFIDGGLTVEDGERIAPRLCEAGVDAIDISCGSLDRVDVIVEPMSVAEGWRLPMARRIREATGKPVICAGVIRHPEAADAAIARGDTDIISLGRALLADPLWPKKARAGKAGDIRPCTSCNWCIKETGGNRGVSCAENPRCGHETDPVIDAFGRGHRAVVVGAGPGGITAALLLDQAGFQVALYEKRPSLGGNLVSSATPPGKEKLFWYRDFLLRRLAASTVTVHTGMALTADALLNAGPAVIVLANGSRQAPLSLGGSKGLPTGPAFEVLLGGVNLPPSTADCPVVIYGGGETGTETAEHLAKLGHHVLLVSRSAAQFLARNAEPLYRMHLLKRLHANDAIRILDHTQLTAIENDHVVLRKDNGEALTQPATGVLLAHGLVPDTRLAEELADCPVPVIRIGDAKTVARIGEAVRDAYRGVQDLRLSFLQAEAIRC